MTSAAIELRLDIAGGRTRVLSNGRRETFGADAVATLLIHPINLRAEALLEITDYLPGWWIAPDLRGHGESSADTPVRLEQYVADAWTVLDQLGIARVDVVGASFGGQIAVAMAATAPQRVRSIVAIGSALRIDGEWKGVEEEFRRRGGEAVFREAIPRSAVAPGTAPEIIERIIDLTNGGRDPRLLGEIWQGVVESDVRGQAERIAVPALVMSGAFDVPCPPDAGRDMAAALRGEFVLLEGTGHLPFLELPQAVGASLAPFLDRVRRYDPLGDRDDAR